MLLIPPAVAHRLESGVKLLPLETHYKVGSFFTPLKCKTQTVGRFIKKSGKVVISAAGRPRRVFRA